MSGFADQSPRAGFGLVERGNIRGAQGNWEESLHYHLEAYASYMTIFDGGHFRIAALSSKLGQHYHRMRELNLAKYVNITL